MRCWGKIVLLLFLCCSLWGCETGDKTSGETGQMEELAPLRLEMAQTQYTLDNTEWEWQIVNETGETYSMLYAPLLEQQQDDGSWQKISCQGGFCGVEDPVEEVTQGSALAEWYPDLQPGLYRLSYRISIDAEQKEYISAQFELTE